MKDAPTITKVWIFINLCSRQCRSSALRIECEYDCGGKKRCEINIHTQLVVYGSFPFNAYYLLDILKKHVYQFMFIQLPSIYLRQLKNAVTSDDVCGRLLPNKSLLTHFKLMELVNRLGAPCTHKLATHTNDVKAVCRLAPLYDHLSEFGIIIQMHLVCLRSFCTYQAHSN